LKEDFRVTIVSYCDGSLVFSQETMGPLMECYGVGNTVRMLQLYRLHPNRKWAWKILLQLNSNRLGRNCVVRYWKRRMYLSSFLKDLEAGRVFLRVDVGMSFRKRNCDLRLGRNLAR
jgi:hypothetical protein